MSIAIPLDPEGKPFKVEGRIMDSSNAVVRDFSDTGVGEPAYTRSFPPLSAGTYRLSVTITDKNGKANTLKTFPPLDVP